MAETTLPLIELPKRRDDGDFLRPVAGAVMHLVVEHDAKGVAWAGRSERGDGRSSWRNGYRACEPKTCLGALNPWLPAGHRA